MDVVFLILFHLCFFYPVSSLPILYSSVLKLRHSDSQFSLHSHGINWGSGSGQQSVTCHDDRSDTGGYFSVQPKSAESVRNRQRVGCGEIIRLMHVNTKRYLHSHLFSSPVSQQQEVSGFGDEQGGDTGDFWKLKCVQGDKDWNTGQKVRLQHVDTGKWLVTSKRQMFTQNNCPNCPINGQLEVSAWHESTDADWIAEDGIYYLENEEFLNPVNQNEEHEHDHDDF